MKEVREQWKPSRFFFGKNKVIAIGLGRSEAEEVEDGLHEVSLPETIHKHHRISIRSFISSLSLNFLLLQLSKSLKGQCGLLFTDCTKKEVTEWFDDYSVEDFARSGCKATETIVISEGPLKQFSHAIEPYLRQLGMPTKLDRGNFTLFDVRFMEPNNFLAF